MALAFCVAGLAIGLRSAPARLGHATRQRTVLLADAGAAADTAQRTIPLTILSGFLGSGKTTLLKHILQNKEGLRVGVVVNDVASVNIDAKLISRGDDGGGGSVGSGLGAWAEDMVEMSNGCACCSAGDDLFASIAELVSNSFMRGAPYDHIVVEASGVSEPRLLRAMFQDAMANDWPLMRMVSVQNMVTVVDASSFLELYESEQRVKERPDLAGAEVEESAGDEVMTLFGETPQGAAEMGVVQLLVEQLETADVVVLNKRDLATPDQSSRASELVTALNGFAAVLPATFSQVPLGEVLLDSRDMGVVLSNEVMDHKSAVDMANWLRSQPSAAPAAHEHSHAEHSHAEHSHAEHSHAESGDGDGCGDPACTDPSHDHSHGESHSHGHEHSHAAAVGAAAGGVEECADAGCDDPSHDHSHAHAEAAHKHSNAEHSHAESGEGDGCGDPACTDPSHDHSHGHSHSHDERQETTAATRFGIRTFVYSRRRPFDGARLAALMAGLPFTVTADAGLASVAAACGAGDAEAGRSSAFNGLMRSKGFVWVASETSLAFFWSQAGRQLHFDKMGQWWASIDRERWPAAHTASILEDFEGEGGDRRQEIVFIGANLAEEAISAALDACLVDEA